MWGADEFYHGKRHLKSVMRKLNLGLVRAHPALFVLAMCLFFGMPREKSLLRTSLCL